MEREHSNVCYIMKFDGKDENGKSIYRFEAVEKAKPFKNQYGLDIFEIKGELTEGRSGLKVCNKDQFESNMAKTTPEQMEKIINGAVEKYGLSPRYTRPEETKKDVFEKKEKDSDGSFLATDVYNERHRYISTYKENDIEFFIKKSDIDEFNATLFLMVNEYMIGFDQKHCLDEAIKRMKEINANGGMEKFLTNRFNEAASNPNVWIDIGVARILDREQEAIAHNEPIKKMREERRAKEDAERKAREEQREREEIESRNNAIRDAEENIRNKENLMNNSVFTENGTETSIVLFLMKNYGISVPLKTQGWINSALYSVVWNDGEVSYRYFNGKNGSKDSTVFIKYLRELVERVNTASKIA